MRKDNLKGVVCLIKQKPLQYPFNALEPYYSEETLIIHYEVLYKGYVDNLNKIEEKLKLMRDKMNYEDIKCVEKNLSFYGSGVILHELFFENMSPPILSQPNIVLIRQMDKDFGGYKNFKKQFVEAAKAVEASRLVFISMGT